MIEPSRRGFHATAHGRRPPVPRARRSCDRMGPTMAQLEDLVPGALVAGIEPTGVVRLLATVWSGEAAVTVTYRGPEGIIRERVVYRSDEGTFSAVSVNQHADTPAHDVRSTAKLEDLVAGATVDG